MGGYFIFLSFSSEIWYKSSTNAQNFSYKRYILFFFLFLQKFGTNPVQMHKISHTKGTFYFSFFFFGNLVQIQYKCTKFLIQKVHFIFLSFFFKILIQIQYKCTKFLIQKVRFIF